MYYVIICYRYISLLGTSCQIPLTNESFIWYLAWCVFVALTMPEDFLSLVVIAFKFARNLAQRSLKLSFVIISLVTSDQPSKVVD